MKLATQTVSASLAACVVFLAPVFLSAGTFDYRPVGISLLGVILVLAAVGISFMVIIQNRYAAANIAVEADQKVVSTGRYGLVRHPMDVGMLIFQAAPRSRWAPTGGSSSSCWPWWCSPSAFSTRNGSSNRTWTVMPATPGKCNTGRTCGDDKADRRRAGERL